MHIAIHSSDPLPLYRQIMDQIRDALVRGDLQPGSKLPSHRELATELVIAPLTVKKAYDELEARGLVETRRGRGTFLSQNAFVSRRDRKRRLEAMARGYLEEVQRLGFTEDEAVDAVSRRPKSQVTRAKGA